MYSGKFSLHVYIHKSSLSFLSSKPGTARDRRQRDKKGMLVDPELVSKLKESSKIRIIKAWNKKCEEAGKKHIAKVR